VVRAKARASELCAQLGGLPVRKWCLFFAASIRLWPLPRPYCFAPLDHEAALCAAVRALTDHAEGLNEEACRRFYAATRVYKERGVADADFETARFWRGVQDLLGERAHEELAVADVICAVERSFWHERPGFDVFDLFDEVLGDRLRSPRLDPAWLSWQQGTAPAVARRISDEGRFDDLPVLADALEDAGCDDDAVLEHCRSPLPHVRGCWVVDWCLGHGHP
jgi:hypothetical protein